MNFFKSILSEDSDPPESEKPHVAESDSPLNRDQDQDPDDAGLDPEHSPQPPKSPKSDLSSGDSIGGGGWSFGGLIKTFATQSESVLETYRRDLREFGSGLRKETVIIREVASRAVKDLPASLEAGASAAHGSLESVGQALDGVLKSTADIISQGKESIISGSDGESETPETNKSLSSGRYSRFDTQLNAIQTDVNTFSKDPEDLEKYKKWKSGFNLEEKNNELEGLIGENGVLESLYKRIVPSIVDHETFWCRYFYKVHKLKQQESVRANLVKRAISVDDDEELSWDVEDDDEDNGWEQKSNAKAEHKDEFKNEGFVDENLSHVEKQEGSSNELRNKDEGDYSIVDNVDKNDAFDLSKKSSNNVFSDEKANSEEIIEVKNDEKVESEKMAEGTNDGKVKSNETVDEEAKGEKNDAGKETVVSSHQSAAEEDLEWDEIEDIESHDEKKVITTHGGSPNKADLRNRLSIAEEDEDLSWDIEDDDEPVKA
ncbi:BSD domain-containing protein [Abeliophyllum distichum]|uniref:BSD domain-containing protein n=1 Tax=Abeliophyllum distichum TaxID=126358 RepID=A0ABD1RBU4_9LAMI